MAAIALTIIILLNYLAFYYAYGAFESSVGTKKKRFFSRQKSRRCAPGGGVVLVFWFWREIVFGVTNVLSACTIQLCGCVVFWLWREIVLKMRTHFYKKILLGYFIMIRSFLKNIETFLCK